MSRKRAEIKLKGEALFPKLGKEDIDFVFEPQRGDESDHYGSGLTFNITVGPKLAVAVASIFANLVVTLANIFLQVS